MIKYNGDYLKVSNNVKTIDEKLNLQNKYLGVQKVKKGFKFTFWAPLAKEVYLELFDENKQKLQSFLLKNNKGFWTITIASAYESKLYLYKILNKDQRQYQITFDPYAKAFFPFDWKGKTKEIPYSVIVDWQKILVNEIPNKPLISNLNNGVDPLIYELHIRDFTSLLNQNDFKNRLGTFNAAIENKIFDYLKDLSITHLQLLPVHSIYTINNNDLKILNKNQGSGWTTNYNWGYDPLNYFALNGWYSNNPKDAQSSIGDFKNFVNKAHENNIAVIIDVVYNHMMFNDLLEKIVPNYYFRNKSKVKPVAFPALNSEAKMVRKLILDSLIYYAKYFGVDGFRFDLSTFIDKQTLKEIAVKLRKINPNIILHGEAWPFSDLDFNNSWTKGINENKYKFAYFNDTIRNAIKGADDIANNEKGLIFGNFNKMDDYIFSVVANLKNFNFPKEISTKNKNYELFTSDPSLALQYVACHDGFTLWDKINVISDRNLNENIALYKQALMMQITSQGRQLILAGTELLQTKPTDFSGQHDNRTLKILNKNNILNQDDNNDQVCDNSYKTTDYTNGIKWKHLDNQVVKSEVFNFLKQLFTFRNNSKFFRLDSAKKINSALKFLKIETDFIAYEIKIENEKVLVIHNLKNDNVNYLVENMELIFSSRSKIDKQNIYQSIPGRTSLIFKQKKGKNE
ncbi:alpha-amylase family glycosyl hydrolase [Mesomycoplasma lagogenitalium]|uniref:Alpha-amylase family glycosyl hydrolase n=1 Tax=Mesomycoplasma lagogenitalium TaxID=171286 RepID=A0ABY8LWF7_9BACT|nr:alpha-amylase family glycosyl hydrolase [Mesomycoplasma lagogenitalium]WGI36751.1 alpha-amylase family glycosyl hydrolase [Mesomycoplasma lagogenitalium]